MKPESRLTRIVLDSPYLTVLAVLVVAWASIVIGISPIIAFVEVVR